MKRTWIVILLTCAVAAVTVAGCTSSSNSNSVASTSNQNTVLIQNYAFNPSTLTIRKGANVTWKNEDSVQHTIVSDNQASTSPALNTGQTWTFQFNTTGTFPYHCSIHPNMKGTISVT